MSGLGSVVGKATAKAEGGSVFATNTGSAAAAASRFGSGGVYPNTEPTVPPPPPVPVPEGTPGPPGHGGAPPPGDGGGDNRRGTKIPVDTPT